MSKIPPIRGTVKVSKEKDGYDIHGIYGMSQSQIHNFLLKKLEEKGIFLEKGQPYRIVKVTSDPDGKYDVIISYEIR